RRVVPGAGAARGRRGDDPLAHDLHDRGGSRALCRDPAARGVGSGAAGGPRVMAIFTLEKRGGAPAEVYWFREGSTNYGFYTSQDVARTVAFNASNSMSGGEIVADVTPLAITRDGIGTGENTTDQNIKVTLPASSAVGALYVGQRPIFTLSLGIYRVHRGDVDAERIF